MSETLAAPQARPDRLATPRHHPDLSREAPDREIRTGSIAIGVFLLTLFGWGALARLDSGVTAPGEVVVYGNRQAVQHRDGGAVSELDVREGDTVKAGQVLLKLQASELTANAETVQNQIIEQDALQARLQAEIDRSSFIAPPADFATLDDDDDRATARKALALQQVEFTRRREALSTEREVLDRQVAQADEQISGYGQELEANRRQHTLVGQELDGLQDLLKEGLVPATRIRQLQQNQAEIDGTAASYAADRARTRQEIGEKRIRSEELVADRDADDAKDLRAVQQQLEELRPKLVSYRDQLAHTTVRAPVAGQVVNLSIFNVGGVVAAGQRLMEIVPDDQPLVIEAKVKPSDAEDLHRGQSAEVRITAFHDRRMPLLHGSIQSISADAISEEKSGQRFYRVDVALPASELDQIRRVHGKASALKPGLPTEVVIPLKARSALDYLVEPFREALWTGFRQR